MVASGTHVGSDCCFDYGNAESTPYDTGNGHMDAVSIATTCYFAPCQGSGPWIEADLENGMSRAGTARPEPGQQLAVRHGRAEEQRADDVRAQGWKFTIGRADDVVERLPADRQGGLQADASGGRDHPRHRWRQQQPQPRHLVRGRDGRRLSDRRCRERGAGQRGRRRLLRADERAERPGRHDHRPRRQVCGRGRRRHRHERGRGQPVGLPALVRGSALDALPGQHPAYAQSVS